MKWRLDDSRRMHDFFITSVFLAFFQKGFKQVGL